MTGYVLLAVVFISKIMYCRGEHGDLKILDRVSEIHTMNAPRVPCLAVMCHL